MNCNRCDKCKLVSLDCIKQIVPLVDVDDSAIELAYLEAQRYYLIGSYGIGKDCFEELCIEQNHTQKQLDLIERVTYLLAWGTYLQWLKIFGAGVNRSHGRMIVETERTVAASESRLVVEKAEIESKVNFYLNDFQEYWIKERDNFNCWECFEACNTCNKKQCECEQCEIKSTANWGIV